ncbi:MAG: linear amide C-N hydrolase, partial [Chitinivibrionales bacterium]|nr:linear amide C-N hydrolase [Chitinivibrionales bacterium]
EWIQYQLDNCASVAEVLATVSKIRVSPRAPAPIHYLVGDSSGTCAAVEFLEGSAVVHTGDRLPVKTLTNNTYASSLSALRQYQGRAAPSGTSSLARFARVASLLRSADPASTEEAVRAAWTVLDAVAMGDYTAWSLVYDLKTRCMYVKTNRRRKVKRIALDDLQFECTTPVRVLDINAREHGDIAPSLEQYTLEHNRNLIARSFAQTDFLRHMSDKDIDFNARIPNTHTRCVDAAADNTTQGKGNPE